MARSIQKTWIGALLLLCATTAVLSDPTGSSRPSLEMVANASSNHRPAARREHRNLYRIMAELRDLRNLVREARASADGDARIRMDYSSLLRDLEKIEAGIDSHLNARSVPANVIEPIRGSYSR